MSGIEQNAEWLKRQREKMIAAINKVAAIVTTENLKPHYKPVYSISLDVHMSGENIELRISHIATGFETVECISYCGMGDILEENPFDKKEIDKRVKEFLAKVKEMQICAEKYAKLNANPETIRHEN